MSTSSTAAKSDPTPSPTPASAVTRRLTQAEQVDALRALTAHVEQGQLLSEDVEAVLVQELEERRQDEEDLAAYEIARAEEGSVSLDELRRELGI